MKYLKAHFISDKGRVRQHNEDCGGIFYKNDKYLLAIVADGMGGHNAGDVASRMAVTELAQSWEKVETFEGPEHVKQWVEQTVQQVNEKLFAHANEHEECKGMGTTLVIAIVSKEFITIGNIGDSRCYLQNEKGFKQMTNDHSLVNELVKSGQITIEDAQRHPRKNVLIRALGTELEVPIDITSITWEAGNRLLLCSDGLSNKLTDKQMEEFLAQQHATVEEKANEMVEKANELGGEDNITVAIIEYLSPEDEGEFSE